MNSTSEQQEPEEKNNLQEQNSIEDNTESEKQATLTGVLQHNPASLFTIVTIITLTLAIVILSTYRITEKFDAMQSPIIINVDPDQHSEKYWKFKNFEENLKILESGKEQVAKSIDILNVTIVVGGVIIAILALFTAFQVTRLEKQYLNAEINMALSKKTVDKAEDMRKQLQKQVNLIKTTFVSVESLEENFEDRAFYYITFLRGISKFFNTLYEDAIYEFEKIENYSLKKHNNIKKKLEKKDLKDKIIADVYFYHARALIGEIDFYKTDLLVDRQAKLESAGALFQSAFNNYKDNGDNSEAATALSWAIITFAYLTGEKNDSGLSIHHCKQTAVNLFNQLDEFVNVNQKDILDPGKKISKNYIYNLACAYSVLYKYDKEKREYRNMALKYLNEALNDRTAVVKQDFVMKDNDWFHFIQKANNIIAEDLIHPAEKFKDIITSEMNFICGKSSVQTNLDVKYLQLSAQEKNSIDSILFATIVHSYYNVNNSLYEVSKLYGWLIKVNQNSENTQKELDNIKNILKDKEKIDIKPSGLEQKIEEQTISQNTLNDKLLQICIHNFKKSLENHIVTKENISASEAFKNIELLDIEKELKTTI